MEKYFYTGRLDGKWFVCYKFSDVPYHLENVKRIRAKSKAQALKIRERFENALLLLPLAPNSKRRDIIRELTSLKVNHDIHG